jgi:hypothetical protein
MAFDNFLALTASMARSPKVWLPALLLGATLGHAPSARALVIFDNTNNLTTANTTTSNSGSAANQFVATTGSGTGSNNGVGIPLVVTNSLYLNDASLQINVNANNQAGARDIGFYLYEATPSSIVGNNAAATQLYTPIGAPLASTTLNFTPPLTGTSAYSTFNFSGTNLGSYLLAAGKSYLLVTGNVTTTTNRGITFGASTAAETPGTTNLIAWNTSANNCTNGSGTCKTDTLTTQNGGQMFGRQATTSTLWKINGTQAVPTPLPLVGAGLAFGYSRRLRRRVGQQASA